MKVLLAGGVFDTQQGRPSSYFQKLCNALKETEWLNDADVFIENGGNYDCLKPYAENTKELDVVFWFADIPNELPKLLPAIKEKNPSLRLIQSKNNRQGKYTHSDLQGRMRDSGAEVLLEFTTGGGYVILCTILIKDCDTPLLSKAQSIQDTANALSDYFLREQEA